MVVAILTGWAVAQVSICAKAGLITFSEGETYLEERRVAMAPGQWPRMRPAETVRTAPAAHVEAMLGPCVVLHVDESSAVRMISTRLTDVQVGLESGSAVAQADGSLRDVRITMWVGGRPVVLASRGTYRFDASPARVKVFAGKAMVDGIAVGSGRIAVLNDGGAAAVEKFDAAERGALELWSEMRLDALAKASGLSNERARQMTEDAAEVQAWAAATKAAPPPASLGPVGGLVTDRSRICAEW
jgi:hypothetical protein